jgi:myo-inositol-1(or 4)-monophosphatase
MLGEAEDVRRTGSAALDLAWTACGRADAYFEAGLQPWDIAAGLLLVREAGGRVCDFRGAALARLDVADARGRQVVAGNVRISEVVQKVVVASGYAASFG